MTANTLQDSGISSGFTNANAPTKEECSKMEHLMVNEAIDESPLRLTGQGNRWFLHINNVKVSKDFETREEAEQEANIPSWNTTINVIAAMILLNEMHKHINKEKAEM